MGRLQRVLLVVIIICLLPACPKSEKAEEIKNIEEIEWATSKNVTVAWDAPTRFEDGTPIPADRQLRYMVYIDKATDDTHAAKALLTASPISETSFKLEAIKHSGRYYIGVKALAYEVKDGEIFGDPITSRISWSSSGADTQSRPFGVELNKED